MRVAIVVPKWGFTAVRRNKLKRRLRELARAHMFSHNTSSDVVLRARREAYDASFSDLADDIRRVSASLT